MKKLWLDRTLIKGPYMALVTSQEEYDMARRRLNRKYRQEPWLSEGSAGAVQALELKEEGRLVCIVSLRLTDDPADMTATLVHESVHVLQHFFEQIGESEPSKEFQAYALEGIFTTLHEALAKRIVKNGTS